ncbi:MAG: hypothetical protein ABL949_01650 [Fimbriimonadaceae bacterium]
MLGHSSFSGNASFGGYIGIGNSSPSWPLHITSSQLSLVRAEGTATAGQTATGYFTTASPSGNAIFARADPASGSAAGIRSVSNAASGFGVHTTNSSPTGFALLADGNVGVTGNLGLGGNLSSPSTGRFNVTDDRLTGGQGSATIQNGVNFGYGSNYRRSMFLGSAGPNPKVDGMAVLSQSTSGGDSTGIYSLAFGTGVNYGVWGSALGGTTNWSGYFDGALFATSASSSVKAFMIDHPLDPANKILTHSSIESDERKNIYDGLVTTDANGFATVTMPNWFEALNEDFRYQLTVNGDESADFVQVKIAQKLRNGKFKIPTSQPNVEVNWMITGRRHDPTSNYYPLEVERTKTKDEKGKFYAPEAYGKDPSLGMGYRPAPVRLGEVAKRK